MEKQKEKLKNDFKNRLYKWVLNLVKILDGLPKDIITQRLVDQLFRSGSSIGANYVEAQAASSKKDYINFFHYSLKSANESKFWLSVLRDTGRGKHAEIEKSLNELQEISNILGASILRMKGKR